MALCRKTRERVRFGWGGQNRHRLQIAGGFDTVQTCAAIGEFDMLVKRGLTCGYRAGSLSCMSLKLLLLAGWRFVLFVFAAVPLKNLVSLERK